MTNAQLKTPPPRPQLNVFYNVRSEAAMRKRRDAHDHAHEAFHLSVELYDFDPHDPHLVVCCR